MPSLEAIYFKNIYEIALSSKHTLSFSLENFTDDHFFDRSFAIITAHNPNNQPLTLRENESRNGTLYSELNSRNILPANGCHNEHCEDGFLIFDITLADALLLGLKHKQVAIFYCDEKDLMYIDCKNGEVMVERSR